MPVNRQQIPNISYLLCSFYWVYHLFCLYLHYADLPSKNKHPLLMESIYLIILQIILQSMCFFANLGSKQKDRRLCRGDDLGLCMFSLYVEHLTQKCPESRKIPARDHVAGTIFIDYPVRFKFVCDS